MRTHGISKTYEKTWNLKNIGENTAVGLKIEDVRSHVFHLALSHINIMALPMGNVFKASFDYHVTGDVRLRTALLRKEIYQRSFLDEDDLGFDTAFLYVHVHIAFQDTKPCDWKGEAWYRMYCNSRADKTPFMLRAQWCNCAFH